MKYVVDTHILLWLLFEPKKIPPKKLTLLKNPKNQIFVTSISFWEISLKAGLGKLELNGVNPKELPNLTKEMGLQIIEMGSEVMASYNELPKLKEHKDPFDRMIVWYCICNDISLVSMDRRFEGYAEFGLRVV